MEGVVASRRIDRRQGLLDPACEMDLRSSLRRLAWIGFWLAAPGLAGPGALAATLATLADHRPHHISLEADLGHQDLVLCHDAEVAVPAGSTAFAPSDCEGDHRLHVASADSLISRHDGSSAPSHAAHAAIHAPAPSLAVALQRAAPSHGAASRFANRLHRTIVLRL